MNRFRSKPLRAQYDAMIEAYCQKSSALFCDSGEPHRGSGIALAFWNGFAGILMGTGFTRADRTTPAYACWRAGQDCAQSHVVTARKDVEPDHDAMPVQPAARPGEVLAVEGRWNLAALRALQRVTDSEPVWTDGVLGQSMTMGAISVARVNRPHRQGEGRPWVIRVRGYERWHEPTRLNPQWHYTPVWAARTLVEAKRLINQVVKTAPKVHE